MFRPSILRVAPYFFWAELGLKLCPGISKLTNLISTTEACHKLFVEKTFSSLSAASSWQLAVMATCSGGSSKSRACRAAAIHHWLLSTARQLPTTHVNPLVLTFAALAIMQMPAPCMTCSSCGGQEKPNVIHTPVNLGDLAGTVVPAISMDCPKQRQCANGMEDAPPRFGPWRSAPMRRYTSNIW